MTDHTQSENRTRRGLSALFFLLGVVIGGGAMALLAPSVQPVAPAIAPQATIPSETTQAIADLRTGQQKAADQLQAIQQTLAMDEANAKQLSSQVGSVNDKIEALRQSFANQQATAPPEPSARVNRRRGAPAR
jgi:septal ring factor EnvC (AmiA/AmiB activator)